MVRVDMADRGNRHDPHAHGLVCLRRVAADKNTVDLCFLGSERFLQPRRGRVAYTLDKVGRFHERPWSEGRIVRGSAQVEEEAHWRAAVGDRGKAGFLSL
jgi:hypothetical protein